MNLPPGYEQLRPGQEDAIEECVEHFRRGTQVVVLDAPTGSGKTLVGEMVRRQLEAPKTLYLCSTLSLQDQFARSFPYARVLNGRGNYPSLTEGHSADECTYSVLTKCCGWCPERLGCPYEVAKTEALRSPLAVLNQFYWLTEANTAGRFGEGKDNRFMIVDECDRLADELLRFYSLKVSVADQLRYCLGSPERITNSETWSDWAKRAGSVLMAELRQLPEPLEGVPESPTVAKERKHLLRSVGLLNRIGRGVPDKEWVYEPARGRDPITFKPVVVSSFGSTQIWRHGGPWLLMSATPISTQVLLEDLGWDGVFETVRMDSTFPVESRRVIARGCGSMGQKTQDESVGSVAAGIEKVLAKYPDERVLVHCHSFALAEWLARETGCGTRRVFIYARSVPGGRDRILESWLGSERGVLFAPAFARGVDLDGDKCHVQVIAKVPFPNLGDRQIKARAYGTGWKGKLWYQVETLREVVQMCGRVTRSADDWGVTYILDSDWMRVWREGKHLLPKWFKDAVVFR